MNNINPKVIVGALSGGGGGGVAAVLLVWILQSAFGVPDVEFTPDRVIALTSLCAVIGSFVGGYLKRSEPKKIEVPK